MYVLTYSPLLYLYSWPIIVPILLEKFIIFVVVYYVRSNLFPIIVSILLEKFIFLSSITYNVYIQLFYPLSYLFPWVHSNARKLFRILLRVSNGIKKITDNTGIIPGIVFFFFFCILVLQTVFYRYTALAVYRYLTVLIALTLNLPFSCYLISRKKC